MNEFSPRKESFCIDYKTTPLSHVYIKSDSDSELPARTALFKQQDVVSVIENARTSILLSVNKLTNDNIIKSIATAVSDRGIRVYILLGDSEHSPPAIDVLAGKCCIRAGVSQAGALLVVDHVTTDPTGTAVLSDELFVMPDGQDIAVDLMGGQISDAVASFCKLFWEHATDQYLTQGKKTQSETNPDGDIQVNHSHHMPGRLKDAMTKDTGRVVGSVNLPDMLRLGSSSQSHAQLYSLSHPLVEKAAREHLTAVMEVALPSQFISEDATWILPRDVKYGGVNWALREHGDEAENLRQDFERSHSQAAWQSRTDIRIGDLEPGVSIRVADQLMNRIELQREQRVDLGSLETTTMTDYLGAGAEQLAEDQTRWTTSHPAQEITYSIELHPPYCPATAVSDRLVSRWAEKAQQWQQQLNILVDVVENSLRKLEAVDNAIKQDLAQITLGQKTEAKIINEEVRLLVCDQWYSTTPATRDAMAKQLRDIAEKVDAFQLGTNREIGKARQKLDWTARRQKLQHEVASYEEKLKALESQVIEQSNADAKGKKSKSKSLSASVESLKGKLKNSQTELLKMGDSFEYDSAYAVELDRQLRINRKPVSVKVPNWPDEQLPLNNLELRKDEQGKRWLIVSNRSDLEVGFAEAERLNATLCTERMH
jgi:hypothetical protein